MTLTEQGQRIVDKNKEWGFGSYLQWAWLTYPDLQEKILQKEKYPEKELLSLMVERMSLNRAGFDLCYLYSLPEDGTNPLKIEQKAWRLLSPLVRSHVKEFSTLLVTYSPINNMKDSLLLNINTGWNLLQYWNVLSDSFKAKLEHQPDDIINEEEGKLIEVIKVLGQSPKY